MIAAPMKAPAKTLIYVPVVVLIEPPSANMTIATPRLEPVEIPNIDGPARGLLNVVCNSRPATERPAPASIAVQAIGSRVSITIIRHVSFSTVIPVNEFMTSLNGILTEPKIKHEGNNNIISIVSMHNVIVDRLNFKFSSIILFYLLIINQRLVL